MDPTPASAVDISLVVEKSLALPKDVFQINIREQISKIFIPNILNRYEGEENS